MSDRLRDVADRARAAQAAVDALGADPIRHDCAAVERECMDLHQLGIEAVRRMSAARQLLAPHRRTCEPPCPIAAAYDVLADADLREVLDRTAQPQDAV